MIVHCTEYYKCMGSIDYIYTLLQFKLKTTMLESKHIDIVIDTTAEQESSADTIDVRQKLPGPPCKKTCSQSDVLANETSDEMLARVLQEEEKWEIERQKEKEKEEFHKLQHKYGMNSASGYADQYTQSLNKDVSKNKLSMPEYYSKKEKLLDSLLSGEESGETCTTGVINHLQQQIRTKGPTPNHFVRLCCPTDHFSSSYGDKSWGCGYRNLQMLLSALIKLEHYKGAISKVCQNIPSIPTIQQLIEDAWRHGYDQQGAAQLDHKLTKTKKWIGATEIAVALKFIGLRYTSGSFCSKRTFPQNFSISTVANRSNRNMHYNWVLCVKRCLSVIELILWTFIKQRQQMEHTRNFLLG
ncbi:Hypothetical predicted protein [Paramuricea clavata]|uniref:UFSP1/2/DUB catalytic domain-containing protein n=1 Tax=Paramuricea clavata TaxID=317549 RepID=A0A6S7FIL5_PARCT|nr:Hypothetical predicted protein [Paramuricea clavata]